MSKHAERVKKKTARLLELLLLLQSRSNMTTRELAEYFGVSRRTIFRDLRALSDMGVPLTYGEKGGYEILEGYHLPPLMLTAREAATLLIGTQFARMQQDASLQREAERVAMKIRAVLPQPLQEFIDRLQQRTVLDPYWIRQINGEPEEGYPAQWHRLSEAVARQQRVRMVYYVASREEHTHREVDPLGLVYYSDHWNLIGYCHLRKDYRNFRLDQIEKLEVLSTRFQRPKDFDLKTYLQSQGLQGAVHRIVLQCRPEVYARLRREIPAPIESESRQGNTHVVSFSFENLDYLARWLFGFGPEVRVVQPDLLVQKLRDRAAALLAQYNEEISSERAPV